MSLKTLEQFKSTVDPAKATVISYCNLISIFGGPLTPQPRKVIRPKSCRDAFVNWTKTERVDLYERIVLPESYQDWNDFDTYSDLLGFEQDLGYLASAVVIFLECPGAIAELGAFSQIPSLRDLLFIIVDSTHYKSKSFIKLGPIRHIQETHKKPKSIFVAPLIRAAKDFDDHVPAVVKNLEEEKLNKKPSTVAFSDKDNQHGILLALDVIKLFTLVSVTEVQEVLAHFGVKYQLRRVKQILFTLIQTKLIEEKEYGDNTFYEATSKDGAYIDYTSLIIGKPFHRERIKAQAWKEVQNDPYRKNARTSSPKTRLLR
ncbi:retron St85 family effector protein [Nevskia sp.]|uniref:retron St85 family effector protein n=1 Tax=Nevskia sp. TaxID=1929292 RepID=UPI0025E7430B|nr:retron St85 family effector protein [Nevskia sp.]